jgi:hypothetical protein
MSDYRMLTGEEIANFKAQGWEEVEIAELELYLWNNTSRGAILQMKDALKELWKPTYELMFDAMTKLLRKIGLIK